MFWTFFEISAELNRMWSKTKYMYMYTYVLLFKVMPEDQNESKKTMPFEKNKQRHFAVIPSINKKYLLESLKERVKIVCDSGLF